MGLISFLKYYWWLVVPLLMVLFVLVNTCFLCINNTPEGYLFSTFGGDDCIYESELKYKFSMCRQEFNWSFNRGYFMTGFGNCNAERYLVGKQ